MTSSTIRNLKGSTSLTSIGLGLGNRDTSRSVSTTISPDEKPLNIRLQPDEQGIVISNPMSVRGSRLEIKAAELDPVELRKSLLFWDKVVWPSNRGIHIPSNPDIQFLEESDIVVRPSYGMNGDVARAIAMIQLDTYSRLNQASPAQWIMASGENSLILENEAFENGRGILTTLSNAIPVPARDVPLIDVLEFREKRRDEIVALRIALNEFYQNWVNSEDRDHSMHLALSKIDVSCAELLRVSKESKMKSLLSSWNLSVSFTSKDVLNAALGAFAVNQFGLPTVASVVAGAASFVSASKEIGTKNPHSDLAPFKITSSIERELW